MITELCYLWTDPFSGPFFYATLVEIYFATYILRIKQFSKNSIESAMQRTERPILELFFKVKILIL